MWRDLDPQWRLGQSQLGDLLVFTCWSQGATLHKQVQAAWWWHERGFAHWWKYCSIAWQAWNVAHDLIWQSYRPGPPLVFGEKGDYSCHVCPNRRERTSHFPSVYLSGDGRRESRVRTMPWLGSQYSMAPCWGHWCKARLGWPDDRSGSYLPPVVVLSFVTSSSGLQYLKRVAFHVWHSITPGRAGVRG